MKRQKLIDARKNSRYSTADVAHLMGCTKVFIWQIETNNRGLSYSNAIKLANIYKTTPDELFYDDELAIMKETGFKL